MNKRLKKIQDLKQQVITGVASGTYTPDNPPVVLYDETASVLIDGVKEGWDSIEFGDVDTGILEELQENIFLFSGAKTFQQTLEMSQEFQKYHDKIISFKEFNENAGQIFDDYNQAWLESEYNTAINKATSAAKWGKVEKTKDVMPYIKILVVEDESLCEICAQFDGATFPVDSSYSDDMIPPFHYNNCRCTYQQLDSEEVGDDAWDDDELDGALQEADDNGRTELFKTNPGKTGEVFKSQGEDRHPYFEVPAEYKEAAKKNFNLPLKK